MFPLLIVAACLPSAVPSNEQLIAAMPPRMESVIVLSMKALSSETSAFKRDFPSFSSSPVSAGQKDGLSAAIDRILAEGTVEKMVMAGSNFRAAQGAGAGSFDSCVLFLLDRPIMNFEESLKANRDVEPVESPAGNIFKGRTRAPDGTEVPLFVSHPTDTTMVLAMSQGDVEHILRQLRSDSREIPPHWRAFSQDAAIESPAIVIRKYDPTNQNDSHSPINPKRPPDMKVEIDGFVLTIPSTEKVELLLRCKTGSPDRAISFYRSAEMRYYVLPELIWNWEITKTTDGFEAKISVREGSGQNYHCLVVLYSLFGVNMSF